MCQFSIKFSNKIVEIYHNYILIIVPFEEPKKIWFTSKDIHNWIEHKMILKKIPIDASMIKKLDIIATTLFNKELGKPTPVIEKVSNNVPVVEEKEEEHVNWVNSMVDKIENAPESKESIEIHEFIKSAPKMPPEKVFISTTPPPIVEKHGNFMTIKRPGKHSREHGSSQSKKIPYIKTENIKSTFEIAFNRDKETGGNWIWMNHSQRLSSKQFLQFMKNITNYIANHESIEEFEYRIGDNRLYIPGNIPVIIDHSLIETLNKFYAENKQLLLLKTNSL
jgi:hypothetical protein